MGKMLQVKVTESSKLWLTSTLKPLDLPRVASSSFIFCLYWYSYVVYFFVCDSASEFGAMGFTSFLGFSYPNLLLVFSELVIFRNLYHIFLASVGTFSGSFLFYDFCFLYLILG